MKEFELTLRLRNNLLKRRRVELGLSARQFAEKAGLGYATYLDFEGLRKSPLNQNGQWSKSAQAIADFHGLPPEDLWPDTVLAVRQPQIVAEIEGEVALALGGYAQTFELPPTPEDLFLLAEKSQVIEKALNTLRPSEKKALQERVMEDRTRKDVGVDFYDTHSVSHTRIMQIEEQALEKLRDPRLSLPRNHYDYFYNDKDEKEKTEALLQFKHKKVLKEIA